MTKTYSHGPSEIRRKTTIDRFTPIIINISGTFMCIYQGQNYWYTVTHVYNLYLRGLSHNALYPAFSLIKNGFGARSFTRLDALLSQVRKSRVCEISTTMQMADHSVNSLE